jgi:hypothetical protein
VVVCNNALDKIGYDASLFKSLGSLSAEKINRNFYIFTSNKYNSNFEIDEINQIDIGKAKQIDQRLNEAMLVKSTFLNQSRDVPSDDQTSSKELYQMLQQSPVTINDIIFTRSNQVVGITDRKSCYVLFNRQDLKISNRFEYKAITLTTKYLGLIAPSYNNNAEIFISIIHYTNGPVYEAVIYNLRSKLFRTITAKQLFHSNLNFNYKNILPEDVNMVSIMSDYREKYPIKVEEIMDDDIVLSKKRPASLISDKVKNIQTIDLPKSKSNYESKSKKLKEDNLAKLNEDNRILKRRYEELEQELHKKSKTVSDKATADLQRESKEYDRIIKEKDSEIKRLNKEIERERMKREQFKRERAKIFRTSETTE